MIDYAVILTRKYPTALWRLDGEEYSGLMWLDDSEKPQQKTLDDLWPTVQAEMQAEQESAQAATAAAIAHAKSLGFTDEMIAVMYPNLGGN
jgi:hypothetical protein